MNDLTAELNSKLIVDATKLGWYRDRVEAWHRGERVAPITLDIAWTRRCIGPDELVTLSNGSKKRICDVSYGDEVLSIDDSGEVANSTVVQAWLSKPLAETILVVTEAGSLRCTSDHLILTPSGWQEAGHLKVGDHVVTQATYGSRKASKAREDAGMVGNEPKGAETQNRKRCASWGMEQNAHVLGRCPEKSERTPDAHQQNETTLGERKEATIGAHEEAACIWQSKARSSLCGRDRKASAENDWEYAGISTQTDGEATGGLVSQDARGKSYEKSCHQKKDVGDDRAKVREELLSRSGEKASLEYGTEQVRDEAVPISRKERRHLCWQREEVAEQYIERIASQSRFHIRTLLGENGVTPSRGTLAHGRTQGRCGDSGLPEFGLELVCTVDAEEFPKVDSSPDRVGSEVVVGRVLEIKDAGPTPVYDLECYPHHNFIASGIVVHNCNAACGFCAAKTQASASPSLDIPRDVALQFLDDAAEIGVKGISLISDGESTLVDYYEESIEHAAKLGIKIGIGTNGIALDRARLERILPHVTYLRFNFSAGERKRYSEIMGVKAAIYDKVLENIAIALDIVKSGRADTNVNMNLVCDPKDSDQLLPFAQLAKQLGVHYAIIKHCATDDGGMIQINYDDYKGLEGLMKECEALSAPDGSFRVVAKWNRFESKREYTSCHGPQFILQMSGNGLIATCGPYFNERYKAFHIGNVMRTRFKDIFHSERYWEVMRYLGSENFDASKRCPPNCLQTHANKFLFDFKAGKTTFPITPAPPHIEFI